MTSRRSVVSPLLMLMMMMMMMMMMMNPVTSSAHLSSEFTTKKALDSRGEYNKPQM